MRQLAKIGTQFILNESRTPSPPTTCLSKLYPQNSYTADLWLYPSFNTANSIKPFQKLKPRRVLFPDRVTKQKYLHHAFSIIIECFEFQSYIFFMFKKNERDDLSIFVGLVKKNVDKKNFGKV